MQPIRQTGGGIAWIERFDGLAELPQDIKKTLTRQGRVLRLAAGETVFGPGAIPDHMLLMLEGTIRVQQRSDSGRDIVLYRVEAGQSCVMTTACLLAQDAYTAEGIAETDIEAVAVPHALFDHLMETSPAFRGFVMRAYARRIRDLLRVIDDVAFGRIDVRLAARLLDLAGATEEVFATHQRLANELGTAREVISRQLQDFQKRGLIRQTRGRILLSDPARLARLAEG